MLVRAAPEPWVPREKRGGETHSHVLPEPRGNYYVTAGSRVCTFIYTYAQIAHL